MSREATKAAGNVWYEARMRASSYNDRLKSREGAGELLGMSPSAVADTELGLTKVMPPDKAVRMADLYNAPQLLNHYCMHECPIHARELSEDVLSIERIAVKMFRQLRTEELEQVKERIADIAADGQVTEDEIEELDQVMNCLDGLARTASELKIIWRTVKNREEPQ